MADSASPFSICPYALQLMWLILRFLEVVVALFLHVGVGPDHHAYLLQRGVVVHRLPNDAGALEVVLMRALCVVLAVKMRFETCTEPVIR